MFIVRLTIRILKVTELLSMSSPFVLNTVLARVCCGGVLI